MQKIFISNDHTGIELKQHLVNFLKNNNYEIINLGTDTFTAVDYPDYGAKVGEMVSKSESTLGIVICGTGIGIAIAANKIKGIRAALCYEEATAKLARQHDDANVLALGARIIANQRAEEIVMAFLTSSFEGGRHLNRINKIKELESKK